VGAVIEASNERLSILLLIAVLVSRPITAICGFQITVRWVSGTFR